MRNRQGPIGNMAGKGKSGNRIEPSFDGAKRRGGDDMRMEPSDRLSPSRKKPAKSSRSKTRKTPRRSSGGLIGFVRSVVYWCLVMGLWGAIGIGGLVIYYGARMPNANTWAVPERPPNIKIVAVDGTVLANRGSTGGEAQALENMSPYIPQAVIAIEDRRFYSHFGIDPIGLARAMATNVLRGRMVQGGSTLTQQLAKNMFLSPDRTFERKVQEVLLALWLEHNFTKDQILSMYLNRVFFGSNSYGVEAASRRYFNKPARDVTLAEAALLAGLLKAPSKLSPARDPAAAEARAQVVLGAMREAGFVSDSEITAAMAQKPTHAKSYWTGAEHYVADMVMDELPGLIGEVREDIIVDTTLDMGLERKAEAAIADRIDKDGAKYGLTQGALVSVDGTGAIRALVGGKDYSVSQFNRATKAKRQPGSAFKPFVYAAAMEAGRTPDSVRNDAPVKIGSWTPENYDQKYRGQVTLTTALANSLNTIAAQLTMEVSPKQVAKVAARLGIESELQVNASIALGTSEVSLMELTSAYAPFMNGGYKATPHVIRRITTVDGKMLYENTYDAPPRVLSEGVVAEMNQMMLRVVSDGTGKKARLDGWQVAGKTGTTQSFRDALFVGYTSNLTTGVWFGNDDGTSMKKVTGGGLPAIAWHDFMTAAHQGLSPSPLFGTSGSAPVAVPETADDGGQSGKPQTLVDLLTGKTPESRDPKLQVPVPEAVPVSQDTTSSTIRTPSADAVDPALVPPADVGGNGAGKASDGKQTTLLEILTGQ